MTVAAGKIPEHSWFPGSAMAAEAIPFEFLDADHLAVIDPDTGATISPSHYSVAGNGMALHGTITALVEVDPAVRWLVYSDTPREQRLDLRATRVMPMAQYETELDRRALIERELAQVTNRAMLVPRGEDGFTLPVQALRAHKYLAFDGAGRPIPSIGTGAQAQAFEATFTATAGQTVFDLPFIPEVQVYVYLNGIRLVGAPPPFTLAANVLTLASACEAGDTLTVLIGQPGAAAQDAEAPFSHANDYVAGSIGGKLKQHVSPLDPPFDCVGNGLADDTVGFQAAVDFVANSPLTRTLWLPGNTVFKLTAPITSTKPLRICGEGFEPYNAGRPNGSSRGAGSWLYFAHTGKGLVFDNSAAPGPFTTISGVQLEMFGTFRDQPVPAPGWEPYDHDFDLYFNGVSCELERLLLLNATRGIAQVRGGYGRFSARRVWGQFFKVGIFMDKQYDLPIIDHFRAWPFWSDDFETREYMYNNLDALYLLKVDNPIITSFFSIFHRASIRIGQSANDPIDPGHYPGGSVSLLRGTNLDMDIGQVGVWLDDTITTHEVTGEFVNLHTQSDDRVGSLGVLIESERCRLSFVNFTCVATHANAVRCVAGTGNRIELSGLVTVIRYNTAMLGFTAFESTGTNKIILKTPPLITTQLNDAPIYGGNKLSFDSYPVEGASQRVTIAQGGNCALPKGSALVTVCRTDFGNHSAVYLCANGVAVLVTEIGGVWVASTTAPAAGKLSIAYNGVNFYTIYNNTGGPVTISMGGIRMGELN